MSVYIYVMRLVAYRLVYGVRGLRIHKSLVCRSIEVQYIYYYTHTHTRTHAHTHTHTHTHTSVDIWRSNPAAAPLAGVSAYVRTGEAHAHKEAVGAWLVSYSYLVLAEKAGCASALVKQMRVSCVITVSVIGVCCECKGLNLKKRARGEEPTGDIDKTGGWKRET